MTNQLEKPDDTLFNLDELLADVFYAIYKKSSDYNLELIDVSDLNMIRFKLTDYDLDTIFSKTKIKYVGKFQTGIKSNNSELEEIWFKRKGEEYMSMIRIIPYIDKTTINSMHDPINVNQIMRTLLSDLVVTDRTTNILLPIINVDVKGEDLMKYDKVKDLINKNIFYSVQITEKYYSFITLDKFLKENPLDLRILTSIIYQVVDVIYQIHTFYPYFKCNQLFPEMITCYLKKSDDGMIFPKIKLGTFYLSQIDDLIQNNYLKNNQIPNVDATYSDLYQLLNSLWNNYSVDIKKYPKLVTFFDEILPKKIRSTENYLSEKLWNTLKDEEKEELHIKNIRNNTFFSGKDSLTNLTFIESNSLNDNDNFMNRHVNYDYNDDLTSDKNTEDSPADNQIIKMHGNKSSRVENTLANKKYYNNGIEMSNKNSRRKNASKRNKNNDDNIEKEITKLNETSYIMDRVNNDDEDIDQNSASSESNVDNDAVEKTEEQYYDSRPSRVYNLLSSTNSQKKSNNRPKVYHGIRRIRTQHDAFNYGSLSSSSSNQSRSFEDIANYIRNNSMTSFPQNNNISSFVQNNGMPSRINSIGEMLGANPNDFANGNNNMNNYAQLAQQYKQQYLQDQNQAYIPSSQTIPNLPGQPQPGPMYPLSDMSNRMSQINSQQLDNDLLLRYNAAMSAAEQARMSNQSTQSNQSNQSNIDPQLMSAMMQQQGYPQMNQLSQMSQIQQMPYMQQTGGKQNPFFFQ